MDVIFPGLHTLKWSSEFRRICNLPKLLQASAQKYMSFFSIVVMCSVCSGILDLPDTDFSDDH